MQDLSKALTNLKFWCPNALLVTRDNEKSSEDNVAKQVWLR